MSYKWKPSKTQKKEFAIKMQNPLEKEVYEKNKKDKIIKKQSTSKFDYESRGGEYIPTENQHDFALFNRKGVETKEQKEACEMIITGYNCQIKIPHDYIHIVNELRRKIN